MKVDLGGVTSACIRRCGVGPKDIDFGENVAPLR